MEKINQTQEENSEEVFQRYMEDLDLSPGDFDGKILDVGAGSAEFARWAKKHGVSSEIYSIEPTCDIEDSEKGVIGYAEKLPFSDKMFDLVVSNCAIPNIFIYENDKNIKQKIKESILEFVRVVKNEGEIRLGKVLKGDLYEKQRNFTEALNEVIEELREDLNLIIEEVYTNQNTYEYDNRGNRTNILAKSFLIKIRKSNDDTHK